jgi:LacI family transcriptional regulator
VVVDRELGDLAVDQVEVDNEQGGYLAGQYLVRLGHRRIGYIGGPNPLTLSALRLTGFRRALAEAGLELPDDRQVQGDFQYEGGIRGMRQLLDRRLDLSAVFAANDPMAIGAISVLQRAGLRLPDNMSVIGFDNISQATAIYPALTTVAQPMDEMARTSVSLLLDRIKQRGSEARRQIILPTRLIERESCRARAA